MLARWFDRNGIGQFLAPDEKAAREDEPDDESRAPFWQIVAPDPNFEPPKAPPQAAFLPFPTAGEVLCEHCNQWTNTGTSRASTPQSASASAIVMAIAATPTTKKSAADPQQLFTPSPKSNNNRHYSSTEIETLVLSAAKDTAVSMSSPPQMQEARDKVFRLCGSQKAINDRLVKRLRNLLKKDPSLIHARATHLGQLVPDGYTPLMACSHSDHVVAAKVVLETSMEMANSTSHMHTTTAHLDRDLQGRTALHIAAECGHMDMVQLLLPSYQTTTTDGMASPPPMDLLGRTPLGRAVTSPNPTARKRQKELETALFSPADFSVFGVPKPEAERAASDAKLQLAYGIADMPGMRVTMEDAVCTSMWQNDNDGKSYCLLGVCDGHGDRGNVARFIATTVPTLLQRHMNSSMEEEQQQDVVADWSAIWKKTCLELDDKLKLEGIPGGSTAVLALITEELIVVANVGDSRAILVQSKSSSSSATTTTTGLEQKMETMQVSEKEEEDAPPLLKDEEGPPTPNETDQSQNDATPEIQVQEAEKQKEQGPTMVIALSDDHKPNLPEEQARIENAGMKVVPVTFQEDGKEVTIHKVARTDKEQLAVSRSFGDFEYKCNTTLGPEEQAVTAVPDVRVHTRDHDTDMYLILACDGVWDVMENENVMDFVLHQVQVRADITDTVLPEVGDALLRESLNQGSRDNMTTVLVALSKESEKIRPSVIEGKTLNFE